ncbi:MAG: putative selenium-dependent hydroxylase accessory protein YqeC [Firmicutes bacterium]|nr:putative selenium-dependent hydroxylase accessory protein YqeC [Bacillota bacterium]
MLLWHPVLNKKEVKLAMKTESKSSPAGLAHNLGVKRGIIALYGAGGKTTLLKRLARELVAAGEKVLLTTTTKIFRPAGMPAVINNDLQATKAALREKFRHHNLVALGSSLLPGNKFDSIEPGWAKELLHAGPATIIIIEADGAAHRPIKGYASFEPVLPREADLIVPIQGIDALGQTVEKKNVHRPELFARATGAPFGQPLTPLHFARSLQQMIARGRSQSPRARVVPLINKVASRPEPGLLQALAAELAPFPLVDRVLFTALEEKIPIKYILALPAGALKALDGDLK